MIYGYARVSTDGQSVEAQVAALTAAGADKVFREVASGAKTDRAQLRKALASLEPGDVFMATRLVRLARSNRDLLNALNTIIEHMAGFRSLGYLWPDTTTAHGRQMVTVDLAEFECELIRVRTGEGRPLPSPRSSRKRHGGGGVRVRRLRNSQSATMSVGRRFRGWQLNPQANPPTIEPSPVDMDGEDGKASCQKHP